MAHRAKRTRAELQSAHQRAMLPAMSDISLLAVFTTGLVAGAVARARHRRSCCAASVAVTRRASAARFAELLAPLRTDLERYDTRLAAFDRERATQFGALAARLDIVAAASDGLRDQTQQLASALRSPNVRGRWGEVQLKRVVELAGMTEHCDFETQVCDARRKTATAMRAACVPISSCDCPASRCVIVDAKAPLLAYLDAAAWPTIASARVCSSAHAGHLRMHVESLSRKAYWEQLGAGATPEFVVLFLPGEAFFSAALEHDPALLDESAARGVILATPTTLIALLRAVAFGWREARMAAGAREISALGATLYDRLATLGAHMTRARDVARPRRVELQPRGRLARGTRARHGAAVPRARRRGGSSRARGARARGTRARGVQAPELS